MSVLPHEPLALPERARLLHIGLMKTGTTALQWAACRRRRELLKAGVRYPGRSYNHRPAALALMRRVTDGATPRPDPWDELMREVDAETRRRILLSNEFIAGWDAPVAQAFLDELGPRTHVVVTVRNLAALLPSLWQQYVKTGYTEDFARFLSIVLADPVDPDTLPRGFDRHDQGTAVRRWAEVAGPERVTVVVVDKAEPLRVPAAFEALLSLPPGTLDPTSQGGFELNRSLTRPEAGLLLRVNQILAPYEVDDDDLVRILRRGAIARVLDRCTPARNEAGLALPAWAVDRAVAVGSAYADAIAASGVRVVGDLAELRRPPALQVGPSSMPDHVSTEVAAQAVVGALSAGLARGSDFGPALDIRRRPVTSRAAQLARRAKRLARRTAERLGDPSPGR